jgi:hypothetical protein
MNPRFWLTCSIVFLSASIPARADEPSVKLSPVEIEGESAIKVEIDGKPFTEYRFASLPQAKGLPFFRPYFYPVRAADGTELTSDQVRVKGGDHPHHRSLWIASVIDGADHWAHRGPRQRHLRFAKQEGATLEEDLAWEGKDGTPILNERRVLGFLAFADGTRGIDFRLTFTPIGEPVTFARGESTGFCCVRAVKELADTCTIRNAAGGVSRADKSSEQGGVHGKPARWCALSGTIQGRSYGLAIFDHPDNPRHPTLWETRALPGYGLVWPNPCQRESLLVAKDRPLTFRYRVLIVTGEVTPARLDRSYEDYVATRK